MGSPAGVILRREGNARVLLVYGEPDSDVTGDLGGRIAAAIAAARDDGEGHVVIDLGELELIGSSGIRVLLDAVDAAAEAQVALVLRPPGPTVLRIFGVARVAARLFPSTSSRSERASRQRARSRPRRGRRWAHVDRTTTMTSRAACRRAD